MDSGFRCRSLTDPAEIAAAKRLQGRAYVRQGHLPPESLTRDGFLPWHDDPPADRVTWFGVFGAGGDLVATGRMITGDRLPALLGRPGGPGVVEPAGLAKEPGAPPVATLLIVRAFYRDSLRRGDRRWVMTVAPALRTTLCRVVPGAITIDPRPVAMREQFPDVRPEAYAYPASGEVAGFVPGIRSFAASVGGDDAYRRFLYGVADFLEAE